MGAGSDVRGDPLNGDIRWAGGAAVAYGIALLLVVVTIGVVVGGSVPDPGQLLADVTRWRTWWVASQGLLAAQQALLVPLALGLLAVVGASARPAIGFLGFTAVSLLASGVVHGVLGVHLVDQGRAGSVPLDVVVAETELTHAIGDTFWFAGIFGLALASIALAGPIRRSAVLPNGLAVLGVIAAVLDGVQLLWFFVPNIGVAGAIGAVLHSAWFVWFGISLRAMPAATA